ncbi:hypothetical protein [Piscirickettsia salmonis]|uniref:hypothetical protein n=1 Tax=Piscirickettsia salmonis TaxID=1238 RepID=UPI0007C94B2D|nr:hypothetical protein A0O36_02638 [Piscirickettsiaceae bacterium NZ-RLO1]
MLKEVEKSIFNKFDLHSHWSMFKELDSLSLGQIYSCIESVLDNKLKFQENSSQLKDINNIFNDIYNEAKSFQNSIFEKTESKNKTLQFFTSPFLPRLQPIDKCFGKYHTENMSLIFNFLMSDRKDLLSLKTNLLSNESRFLSITGLDKKSDFPPPSQRILLKLESNGCESNPPSLLFSTRHTDSAYEASATSTATK